jgi:serine/threonine protein kinase
MTAWIGDGTLAHLRDVAEWPDVGDRYEVTGRLGRGGMGVVYAAHDRTLDREVAIKVLDAIDGSGDAARRLQHEARILARLEHPGIVPVHDAGTLPDGRVFYVMKLVRGARLDQVLQGEAPLVERLDLFTRIGEAVSFAHAQGIVHRDLTPANVMLGRFGEVLVLDWGVARVLDAPSSREGVVGTPGFMPPEQESGSSGMADTRADVYALGALLQAMVPPPVPRALAAIARKAQATSVDERYQSVEALVQDIARYRRSEPVEAYRETWIERAARVYQRYRVPILLVLAYMLMRLALIIWLGR